MYELEANEYALIEPFLREMEHCIPCRAVVRRFCPGRAYVDDRTEPRIVLIWTPWGYYYLLGDPQSLKAPSDLAGLIADELAPLSASMGETAPILYPSSPRWQDRVGSILRGLDPIRIFRQVFFFDRSEFRDRSSRLMRLYPRYVPRRIDRETIDRLGEPVRREILVSWESVESFLEHGLGYCVLDEGRLVSYCISLASDGMSLEMNVFTHEDYRRRGLATAACEAFISHCMDMGFTPAWECFWGNAASSSLATRLAFRNATDVPVYMWRLLDKQRRR